jgi:hypothetical protein
MKKLMGFILFLLFVLIVFLRKEQDGFTQDEWTDLVAPYKREEKWGDMKLTTVSFSLTMKIGNLTALLKKDGAIKETTQLWEAKTILFNELKEDKRVYTDQEYNMINNLHCNYPSYKMIPLKEFLDKLNLQLDQFNKLKDEHKLDKDATLQQLEDKIKDAGSGTAAAALSN